MNTNIKLSAYKLRPIIIALAIITGFVSCSKSGQEPPINNLPIVSTISIAPEMPIAGNMIQFTTDSKETGNDVSYSWNFGDNTLSTLKNPSHQYEELGNYIVKLTVKSGGVEKVVSKEVVVSLSNDISSRMSLKEKLESLNGKILVCAHRGDHLDAPENSIKSVTDAIDKSIEMVELDIRQTKDGELVLMHDETINRTTNGSGKVSDYLLKDLKNFKLKKDNGTLTDQTIPTLKEILTLARGKIYIDLDIDLKAQFNRVYPVVNQYGMTKQVLFYSSENNVIKDINNRKISEIIEMPIVRNQSDFDQLNGLELKVIQFNVTDNDLRQKIVNKGWYIFRNAYVNTSKTPATDNFSELNQAINIGASIIQTDECDAVKSRLKSQNLND